MIIYIYIVYLIIMKTLIKYFIVEDNDNPSNPNAFMLILYKIKNGL